MRRRCTSSSYSATTDDRLDSLEQLERLVSDRHGALVEPWPLEAVSFVPFGRVYESKG